MAYTLINNCDSVTNWTATNGVRSIDTSDKQEGTGSLKLVTNAAVGEGYVAHDPAGTWDWSGQLHFSVWIKGDTAESGELFIFKDGANYERWSFTYPTVWTLMSFDLANPSSSGGSGNGDYSSINEFRFDINAASKTARYDYMRVDNILALSESFSIADSLIKNAIRNFAEAFSTIDSLVKNVTKQLAESWSIVDSFVKRLALGESFGIIDSITKTANKTESELFNTIDSWTARISFAEILSTIDSLVNSASLAKSEAFSTVDSWLSRIRLSETFQTADSFIRTTFFYLAETLGIIDTYKTSTIWIEEIKNVIDWIEADDTGWFGGWFSKGWFSGNAPWIEETKETINWTKE